MSIARRRILVVSDTLALANNLLMWLTDAGYEPAVVTTFSAAKEQLRTAPDIVITELKLREYNGLHLALRANRDGIPTAVIGNDARHAHDAEEIGARYVLGDNVQRDDIVLLVDGLLSASTPRRPVEWVASPPPAAACNLTAPRQEEWPLDNRAVPPPATGGPVVH